MHGHALRRRLLTPALTLIALTTATAAAEARGSAAGEARVHVYQALSHKGSTATFRVGRIDPSLVRRTQLRAGRAVRRVSTRRVRAALRRDRIVRTRVQPGRRGTPRLVVFTTGQWKRTSPKTSSSPATTATPKSAAAPPAPLEAAAPSGPAGCGSKDGGTFASPTNLPGACWRPYGDDSPFNQRLPAGARTLSTSDAIVRTVTGWGAPEDLYAGAAGTSSDWSHPVYYSSASDPTYTVRCTKSWGTCEVEGMQVRIPAAAQPARGGDGHMAVVDQAGGFEYDFWQVQDKPAAGGTLVVSWGGRTAVGTDAADGLGSDATAAQFGLLAGLIRGPELAAGRIDHALFMVVKCDNGQIVAPALGHGSKCSDGAAGPAMGQRFMLDMSDAEIAALPVSQWKKAILTAMARYGMFVGDTGGSRWGLMLESGASYASFGLPDPAAAFGATQRDVSSYNGKYYFPLDGVDWTSRLKIVDPCVTQRTC